jgi:hypothetical protein
VRKEVKKILKLAVFGVQVTAFLIDFSNTLRQHYVICPPHPSELMMSNILKIMPSTNLTNSNKYDNIMFLPKEEA